MQIKTNRLRISRFFTVVNLFVKIFWAFYSLRFRKVWHSRSWVENKKRELFISEARRFRLTAVDLGGLLIKLGQFFSTRVDVLPQSSIQELTGLQDEVQSVPFRDIKQVAEEDFKRPLNEVYAEVDEMPIASASLGQVHRGALLTGQVVAIKILRPGIEELVRVDLKAIHAVIRLLKILTDWERKIDMDAIYVEFASTLLDELDYIKEAHNCETIANNNQDQQIIFPSIYHDYTTHRVLTMEYMEGIKITNYDQLSKSGIDRGSIARRLLGAYVTQILVDGFFHADPHPGNLFVTQEGKLVMIDFGMVGSIPPELKEILVDLVLAIVKRDNIQVVGYFKRIGFLRYDADTELVARAVGILLEETLGLGVDFAKADFGAFLTDLEQLLYEQPFQIPAQFTFLGRALGTLYGICIGLDPNFNFLDEAKPYLNSFAKEETTIWNSVKEKASQFGAALVDIPPVAARVLTRMDKGEFSVRLPLNSLEETIAANTRANNSISAAIIFGLLFLTHAYFKVHQLHSEARYSLIASLLLPLIIIYFNRTKSRRMFKAPPPHMFRRQGRETK